MKVLFAAWEMDPFFKVGGLGDVIRSLPNALSELGVNVRVILPFYKSLKLEGAVKKKLATSKIEYNRKKEEVIIYKVSHPITRVTVYLIKNHKYLDVARTQETFAFFNKAVIDLIRSGLFKFIPDIIHCHDHHTGLIPLLLKKKEMNVKAVLTIHNLAYQGYSPVELLKKIGLDVSDCQITKWEIASRRLNFLLEGIIHADLITTVSLTYSKEILSEKYGMGLEEVLKSYKSKLYGILNGIDLNYNYLMHLKHVPYPFLNFNTEDDNKIKFYSVEEGKKLNKLHLQKQTGLTQDESIPVLSFIGRFDAKQKGIDILHKMIRRFGVKSGQYQFIILGTGDPEWEERFTWLSNFYPDTVSCHFVFDPKLAQLIYAASDFILIPSKFEPCGLIQMLDMTSGTLPIAHSVGGLTDSIKNGVNGFLFREYSAKAIKETVEKAVWIWKNDRKRYIKMVKTALKSDFSWERSAEEYIKLYKKLVVGRPAVGGIPLRRD